MKRIHAQSAFSLVELSIVLVILGLLTGGILGGQSLIRAAELRSVSTEYGRYITASQTFRDKYFALPGDFRDATRVWGLQVSGSGCASTSGITTVSTPGACDGNGNGQLTPLAANEAGEVFQYWRQLSLAGLIEGSYTGIGGPNGTGVHSIFGTNVPRSKLSNAGWGILTRNAFFAGDANNFDSTPGTYFIFGAVYSNDMPFGAVLSPEELWNIDTKMDDGRPATGKIIAHWRTDCTNSTGPSDSAATYKLDIRTPVCSLFIIQQL